MMLIELKRCQGGAAYVNPARITLVRADFESVTMIYTGDGEPLRVFQPVAEVLATLEAGIDWVYHQPQTSTAFVKPPLEIVRAD